jgi:hypothetical protein
MSRDPAATIRTGGQGAAQGIIEFFDLLVG